MQKRESKDGSDIKSGVNVTTIEGTEIPRSKARRIGGEYFTPNVSVFNIKGTNYRITSPAIAYDYTTGEYRLKEEVPYYGVVGFVNGQPKLGYFSVFKGGPNITIPDFNGEPKEYPLLSTKIIPEDSEYKEDLSTGNFKIFKEGSKNVKTLKSYLVGTLHYNANSQNPLVASVKKHFEKNGLFISKLAETLGECVNNYSFGIEFETNNGTIPYYKVFDNGLVPLKDGSLKLPNGKYPYEYTTIPLNGKKGIQAILNICEDLSKYCTFDRTCSAHIHFGNVRLDKVYLLAYYQLIRIVQDQMFKLVPHYKTDPVKIANLEKNYCQKLISLAFKDIEKIGTTTDKTLYNKLVNSNYKVLYAFLAGQDPQDIAESEAVAPGTTRRNHPQGDSKWNRRNRYFVQNLLPAVFDGGTIESRLHQGTFNADKILGWMFLNISLLWYADKNTLEILSGKLNKITLDEIMESYAASTRQYEFLSPIFSNYLRNRRSVMRALYSKEDYLGIDEIKVDTVSIKGLFLNSSASKVDEMLRNSLMIFNNRGYVQGKSEAWKNKLPKEKSMNIDSHFKTIEKNVNIE